MTASAAARIDAVGRASASAAATASARFEPPTSSTRRGAGGARLRLPLGLAEDDVAPGATTASFSAAIASRVSPSTSVCSSETFVSTTTRGRRARSSRRGARRGRPRRPPTSTSRAANSASAAAVSTSNCVAPAGVAVERGRARRRGPRRRRRPGSAPTSRGRAARCRRRRAAPPPRRSAAVISVVEVFPFVPTTWIAGKRALRIAEVGEERAHPPESELLRPRREPLEPGDGRPAVERARAQRPVALELLALGLDDLGGRVRDERARSRASPRRARSPSAAARARRSTAPSVLRARRRSGLTTASKIRFSSPSSATSAPLRRKVAAALWTRSIASAAAGSPRRGAGPGAEDQPRVVVELRPDLLGHVREHRMEQGEQPLERRERRRDRGGVVGVEPRLDRLGVPVAEVVEGQVVERVGGMREVEARQQLLELGARLVDPADDPALLERLGPELGLDRRRPSGGSAARRSRACSRASPPSSIAPQLKRTSCVEEIFSRP